MRLGLLTAEHTKATENHYAMTYVIVTTSLAIQLFSLCSPSGP